MVSIPSAVSAAVNAAKAAADRIAHQPPQPKQHTVTQRETIASIAKLHHVPEKALRDANPNLLLYVEPPVGMVLNIPVAEADERIPVAGPVAVENGGAKPGDPATVDQAAKNLQTAESNLNAVREVIASGNGSVKADLAYYQEGVNKARADLRSALDREITASGNSRPTGSTNDAAHVRSEGAAIAKRYEGNPTVKAAIEREVAGLAVDREVSDTKTIVLSSTDPKQMGKLLTTQLSKLSPEAQAKLLQDADIKRWIVGDFGAVDPSKITTGDQQIEASAKADAFAQRLADVTSQLPPEQAEALTRSLMPEIQKAGGDKLAPRDNEAGRLRFDNLSRIAARMGQGPEGDAIVADIANAYGRTLGNSSFLSENVSNATLNDGGPRLAVAIAQNLQGRTDVPSTAREGILNGVNDAVQLLRQEANIDVQKYGEHMAKVNSAAGALDGLPGAAEARQKFIEGQPKDFQDKMNALAGSAADSGNKLAIKLAGLSDLPPETMEGTALQETLGNIATDRSTQAALIMGAQKDPGALEGDLGKQVFDVMTAIKVGKEGLEFTRGYSSIIVGVNQSKAIDLAAAGKKDEAHALLKKFAGPGISSKLGMDDIPFEKAQTKLTEIVEAAGDPAKVSQRIGEMNDLMKKEPELMTPNSIGGRLFRGVNLAASITLAGKSVSEAIKEGGGDKWLSAGGDLAGVAKDGTDLVTAMMGKGALDSTRRFLATFSAISIIADLGKMVFTDETTFDRGMSGMSAMGGGFMLGAGWFGGPAGAVLAFAGFLIIGTVELAKGQKEQEKQLWELNGMSGKALELLVEHGLDPDAIPDLRRRGGDSGEFAAAPVLVQYLAQRGYTPEQALAWINDAQAKGKLESVMDTAVRQSTELGENPGDAEVKAESDAAMEKTIRATGLPLK